MRPVVDGTKIHLPNGMTTQQAVRGLERMLGSYKSGDLVFEEETALTHATTPRRGRPCAGAACPVRL